ncbi:MAG: M16 family metallopeptidase, partial [Acidimicrobiia bacterium]
PIPSQPAPRAPDMTEPEQKGERRKTIEDNFAQTPRIDIVYKIPPGNTPAWYALNVVGQVLAAGNSSRLYQKLVKDKELAVSVFGGAQERRGPSLGSITINVKPGKDFAEIEKLVYEEIERLKTEPVADWELEKVRNSFRRALISQKQSTLSRAILLGQYAVYYNDPGLINEIENRVAAVTPAEVQRVASTFLKDASRTVIITVPKAKAPTQVSQAR